MGCGCGGSTWVPPTSEAIEAAVIVTDANDPNNFWTGPPTQDPPAAEAPAEG